MRIGFVEHAGYENMCVYYPQGDCEHVLYKSPQFELFHPIHSRDYHILQHAF